MKKNVLKIVLSILAVGILYYFFLPPLNIHSPYFWFFVYIAMIIVAMIYLSIGITDIHLETLFNHRRVNHIKNLVFLPLIPLGIFLLICLINIVGSPLFHSKAYHERITVDNGDFVTDVPEVDFNHLALLDKDSSSKLGDRVMGQMTDLVSQFYVSNLYTQINYQNTIVRVTPLEYDGIIKYFTNRKGGVKGYITVNSVSGEANLVRLENGMKYMPSSLFSEDLNRKLRFTYPTTIFGEFNFEIDESGNPYWIIQTITYKGVGLRKEVSGIIIFDPKTGNSQKYNLNEIPTWVDHVYSADLILEQLDDWGQYKNGFLNSILGQKEVVMTTDGYNYLAMNDDIYLYTGITSVASDESNIGFVLTNLRTKQTHFYNVAGAEEYSAMDSSMGAVQQMNYTSTFPLLINLNGKPTYLMSLKDNAGLVKMYSFVDYTDYQKVVVTDSSEGILNAAKNYLGGSITRGEELEKEITITSIKTAVLDGTTYYYLKADTVYRASLKVAENILPFINVGDKIKIVYKEAELYEIIRISE